MHWFVHSSSGEKFGWLPEPKEYTVGAPKGLWVGQWHKRMFYNQNDPPDAGGASKGNREFFHNPPPQK